MDIAITITNEKYQQQAFGRVIDPLLQAKEYKKAIAITQRYVQTKSNYLEKIAEVMVLHSEGTKIQEILCESNDREFQVEFLYYIAKKTIRS